MNKEEKINNYLNYLNDYLQRNSKKILIVIILIYVIIFSVLCLYKYLTYNYIGIDLAIFNQVFYNSSLGDFFELTIHPHLYLGDHFALIIPLLIPFYFLLRSPVTLLIMQTLFLALGAWPLYLIARQKLSKNLSLFISFFYLSHLFVHNINTYEFHILSLAIPLLFFLFYFYKKGNFALYTLFLVLCLSIREDLALVIFMFGLLALIDRKKWHWSLLPIILSIGWFIFAMKMTGEISGYGQYKFVRYYGWLGDDIKSIILGAINHPWVVIKHIFSFSNISFLVGLFLPFLFLPLLKPKYILPSTLIILQILFLTAAGPLALEIHYVALIIPFLFISLVYSIKKIYKKDSKYKITRILNRNKEIIIVILILASLYSSLVMGPLFYLSQDTLNYAEAKKDINIRKYFTSQIPEKSAVATGFHFLPQLSSRKKIYSLHYQYLGKKQYSNIDYSIPSDVEYLLFDMNDFLYYQFLYQENDENNIPGASRIRKLIKENDFHLTNYIDKYFLYTKKGKSVPLLYEKEVDLPNQINSINKKFEAIELKGYTTEKIKKYSIKDYNYEILPLTLYWQCLNEIEFDYQIKIHFTGENSSFEESYPLSALYPTHDWKKNEIIKVNYQILMPEAFKNIKYQIGLSVYHAQGNMGLNKSKIFRPQISQIDKFGRINLLGVNQN